MAWWRSTTFLIYGMRAFGKNGYEALAKDKNFEDLTHLDLKGKSVMITGANAGLGLSVSTWFAHQGSTVHMVCRNKERGEKAHQDVVNKTKNDKVVLHLADISSLQDVRSLANRFLASGQPLDVLINNAGILCAQKLPPSADGHEITLATNVLGGFLLTNLLVPVLQKSPDPRVILVSSGGGLTEKLTIRSAYDKAANQPWNDSQGRALYALTKRQQIVLAEKYKEKMTARTGIAFYSMHPGWCDTEGLAASMPSFYNTMKNRLRTLDEGADTINWLAASPSLDKNTHGGLYFRDRKPENKHLPLGGTSYSAAEAEDMWSWFCELTNWKLDDLDQQVNEYEKMLTSSSAAKDSDGGNKASEEESRGEKKSKKKDKKKVEDDQ